MRSFSILSMIGFLGVLAVGMTALRVADEYWAGGLLLLTIFLLCTAVLAVFYRRGQARAGWLGFLVFAGVYTALAMLPGLSQSLTVRLPTTKFLDYAHARADAAGRLSGKLRFQVVDPVTGKVTLDEAAIRADPAQAWMASFPGAANSGSFQSVGHCLFALSAGWVGAVIARRFEREREVRAIQPT